MAVSYTQVADYLESAQAIMDFARKNEFDDFSELENRFVSIQESFNRLKVPERKSDLVKCAVVGAFSCGKSAFINSLLKEEVAPVEINPLTHGLTSFKYGKKESITDDSGRKISREKYVKDVQDVSSAGSHFVVEHPMVPQGLEIIDSPGFSATRSDEAAARKDLELSKEAVNIADVVFLLINIEEGSITQDCLSYIQTTLDLKRQPLYIVLTWGETKTKRERERVQDKIVSQCREHDLPLEECIPYCSMGEEYLSSNYPESYVTYFRECKEKMIDMLNSVKKFKKDQAQTYSTAKQGLFLKSLTEFQARFDLIVSDFGDEVIARKYDKLIQSIRKEYTETAEKLADKYAEFSYKKSTNSGKGVIAEIEEHCWIFDDHIVNVNYNMVSLSSSEEQSLFKKVSGFLAEKSAFLSNSALCDDMEEVCKIYRSVVKSLIKEYDLRRCVYWWGDACECRDNLVKTMREEFHTSSDSFLPEIKKALKNGVDQETRRLNNEKKTLLKQWNELETRFSQTSKQITEGMKHA